MTDRHGHERWHNPGERHRLVAHHNHLDIWYRGLVEDYVVIGHGNRVLQVFSIIPEHLSDLDMRFDGILESLWAYDVIDKVTLVRTRQLHWSK
jgi:hypothetical protein